MSTTLTNGLKLPDKGSVDWYADMQNNYAILDGAVGTVAEHTSQIAGKAPLVHTHTKADITDFPAYGTTAGTICEGNDSRLSDARTPVAHTHGKSDVTDLFNSANTWSANNIYTYAITLKQTNLEEGVLPASNQTKRFGITDKNNANLGWLQHRINTSGDSYLEFYVVNKFSNGQLSTQGSEIANILNLGLHSDGSRYFTVAGDVYPDLPTRVCNLGTSTNKWKTLNGVNPGALSLPNLTANSPSTQNPPNGWISIDTTDWDKTGNLISYIPPVDGWISIITDNSSATNYIRCAYDNGDILAKANGNGYAQGLSVFLPVLKNVQIGIRLVCTTIGTAKLYPCQGNV